MGETEVIDDRALEARRQTLCEMIPYSAGINAGFCLGVAWVLCDRLPIAPLAAWCIARVLVGVARIVQARAFMRTRIADSASHLTAYRVLAFVDALAWSTLGWAMTPVQNMEICAVTIGVLLAVSALGVFMLHVDMWSAVLFISPIMMPNALYALTRQDKLGVFCAVAVLSLYVLLVLETRRSNWRLRELFILRFRSDGVARAQLQALRQAQALSEAKSRFVATMSHEMRTPLHGILGLARLLAETPRSPEDTQRLQLIRGAGEHLVSVINDVLDFSRMESRGGLPIHAAPFDLPALLEEVAETSRVGAAEKGLAVHLHIDPACPRHIEGDAVRVRQVLHNLLGNAVKFTLQGRVEIRVAPSVQADCVAIAVHDTGIGIPPQDIDKVFEAFHQAEGTYQRRFGGTGLGLTISRDLCRAMGGELTCQSVWGQGSVFEFTLPIHLSPGFARSMPDVAPPSHGAAPRETALPPPHEPAFEDHDAPWPGEPHVLLVEDNSVNVLVAQAQLLKLGMKVSVAHDGLEAVQWLRQNQADIVLMDCEMPNMDGFDATRRIREEERARGAPQVPIVALTANGSEVQGERCRGAGMNDYLAKPFRPQELAVVLRRHLHFYAHVQPEKNAADIA